MNKETVEKFREFMENKPKKNGYSYSKKYVSDLVGYVEKLPEHLTIESFNRFVVENKLWPNTVRALASFLEFYGFDRKMIRFEVHIPPKKQPRYVHEEKILTYDQVKKLINESKDEDFKLVVRYGWDTLARSAEIRGIEISDILFDENMVIFRKVKGGDSDIRPISETTKQETVKYMEGRGVLGGFLFQRGGEQFTSSHLRYIIKREVGNILGKHFTTHWLRHTSSEDYKNMGADEEAHRMGGGWKSNANKIYFSKGNMARKKMNFQKYHRDL